MNIATIYFMGQFTLKLGENYEFKIKKLSE